MTSHATTIATLRPDQISDLRLLHVDPRHPLQPVRRKMLVKLGLIRPAEPKRLPQDGPKRQKVRAHVLTLLGEQAIAAAPPAEPSPLRCPPSAGYVVPAWVRTGKRAS